MTVEAAKQAALQLIGQYGEDAEVICVLRAAEVAALQDLEALAYWDSVRQAIQAFSTGAGTRQ